MTACREAFEGIRCRRPLDPATLLPDVSSPTSRFMATCSLDGIHVGIDGSATPHISTRKRDSDLCPRPVSGRVVVAIDAGVIQIDADQSWHGSDERSTGQHLRTTPRLCCIIQRGGRATGCSLDSLLSSG